MNVKEMHIETNQGLQKIAANRTRKFFGDELDWLLNKNMERYVQSNVTPKADGNGGFEVKQFSIDAIRPLMKTGVELPAFIADPRRYGAVLPGDYAYLISDEAVIKLPGILPDMTPEVPIKTDLARNLLLIPFKRAPNTVPLTPPYYPAATLTINGNIEFDLGAYTLAHDTPYTGYSSPYQLDEIISCMLMTLCANGWHAYWERVGDQYYPRTLVIVSANTIAGSLSMGAVVTNGTILTRTVQTADLPNEPTQDQANRLTASHIVQNLREVAFYKTQPESPISELQQGILYVYANKTFIVTNMRISYVRKHRRISLVLGTDCDLAPEFHQMVCDLTVEYILGMIANPNWEVKLKDDMKRTPLP